MKFIKMQGLGNDFVFVDGFQQEIPEELSLLSQKVCHRQLGVGADGLVLILPSCRGDVKMRIFNPDGTEAEMCGNAIRCVAKYMYVSGRISKRKITVETLAGMMKPELIIDNGTVTGIRVDMGEPRFAEGEIPVILPLGNEGKKEIHIDGSIYPFTALSMGNPHCVIFVEDVELTPVREIGPKMEKHHFFPAKTNVEFVQILSEKEIKMRVWERGAGETLACGTGACAAAVSAALNGKTARKMTVHLPGGDLLLEWAGNNHVFMTGPAEAVFEGEYFN
jgi:diaminopimelate epimerase